MKRIFVLALVFIMAISIIACSENNEMQSDNDNPTILNSDDNDGESASDNSTSQIKCVMISDLQTKTAEEKDENAYWSEYYVYHEFDLDECCVRYLRVYKFDLDEEAEQFYNNGGTSMTDRIFIDGATVYEQYDIHLNSVLFEVEADRKMAGIEYNVSQDPADFIADFD